MIKINDAMGADGKEAAAKCKYVYRVKCKEAEKSVLLPASHLDRFLRYGREDVISSF